MRKPDRATVCLCCWKRKKRKDYQFCSKRCTDIAAKNAPQLLRVPMVHVMYKDVAKAFRTSWQSNAAQPLPQISRIYLITWSKKLRSSFDAYREKIAKKLKNTQKPKEVKRFRSETRYCRLGDPGKSRKLCKNRNCRLCRAIATGFKSSLEYKRKVVQSGQIGSARFGVGIYMAPSSSTAYKYAVNAGLGNNQYRAMLSTRVVLGKSEIVYLEDWTRTQPMKGYDSIEARPISGGPTELVAFNADMVRPAYLLILKVS